MKDTELKIVCDAYETGVADGKANAGYFKHDEFKAEDEGSAEAAYFYGREVGIRQEKEEAFEPRVLEVAPLNKWGQTPIVDAATGKVICFVPDETIARQIAHVLSGAYHNSINQNQ